MFIIQPLNWNKPQCDQFESVNRLVHSYYIQTMVLLRNCPLMSEKGCLYYLPSHGKILMYSIRLMSVLTYCYHAILSYFLKNVNTFIQIQIYLKNKKDVYQWLSQPCITTCYSFCIHHNTMQAIKPRQYPEMKSLLPFLPTTDSPIHRQKHFS